MCTRMTASPATKERTPETSTRAGSCETASTSADIEPRLMSNAAASAIRDGPIRPAIVFEFAMDCLPARCRCGTSTDKNTHHEEPVRRSAATGPTPAISRRERAEKEHAPPLHDNPKARRRGGRHTRGPAACCDARFRAGQCPLWVTSRLCGITEPCPLYPRKRTKGRHVGVSALCQSRLNAPQQKAPL